MNRVFRWVREERVWFVLWLVAGLSLLPLPRLVIGDDSIALQSDELTQAPSHGLLIAPEPTPVTVTATHTFWSSEYREADRPGGYEVCLNGAFRKYSSSPRAKCKASKFFGLYYEDSEVASINKAIGEMTGQDVMATKLSVTPRTQFRAPKLVVEYTYEDSTGGSQADRRWSDWFAGGQGFFAGLVMLVNFPFVAFIAFTAVLGRMNAAHDQDNPETHSDSRRRPTGLRLPDTMFSDQPSRQQLGWIVTEPEGRDPQAEARETDQAAMSGFGPLRHFVTDSSEGRETRQAAVNLTEQPEQAAQTEEPLSTRRKIVLD